MIGIVINVIIKILLEDRNVIDVKIKEIQHVNLIIVVSLSHFLQQQFIQMV